MVMSMKNLSRDYKIPKVNDSLNINNKYLHRVFLKIFLAFI